jgi:hypothetical protein
VTQLCAGNWQLVSVADPCGVSVTDTGANVRTVVVSAPGPQGPAGAAGSGGGGGNEGGIGGGGLLAGLADVSIGAVGNGDLLTFDAASSVWTNAPRSQITDGGNF